MSKNSRELIHGVAADFDGTFTDTTKEAQPFIEYYLVRFCAEIGIDRAEVEPMVRAIWAEIESHPEKYNWEVNGFEVGPATDPYLINNIVYKRVFDQLREQEKTGPIQTLDFDELNGKLYKESYPHADTVFRNNAIETLSTLNNETNLVIVSNSSTDGVRRKLESKFGDKAADFTVVGGAKKFVINPDWQIEPSAVQPPGFPIEVLLQRQAYYQVLSQIENLAWVIGDNFSLDLAIAEYVIRMKTALVKTAYTPNWELAHYNENRPEALPYGLASDSLETIVQAILASLTK